MRVLVSWLRDFVDVPVGIEELAAALIMRGFEVAAVEPPPAGLQGPGPDAVLDLEVTTNRPDCLGLRGIAREVAAIYDRPVADLPAADPATGVAAAGPGGIDVALEEPELCPRYAAAVLNVHVGPSPSWLAARLQAAGIRPISNVVDVSNYVMLELGHPTHAFDLARLAGPVLRIRRAQNGERIRTLDGETRTLDDHILVIADAERPQAVAGVMGGADSEVTASTNTIALESACFQPASVRRASRRLGLKTEASARFERGADVSAPVAAIARACALLEQIGAARRCGVLVDRYPAPREPARIGLRGARIAHVLGEPVEPDRVERILARLGFEPVRAAGADAVEWRVAVPTARVDVTREIDLIEEVARHHGYDRLPATFPALTVHPPKPDPRIEQHALVRTVLTGTGFSEAVTYGLIEREAARAFGDEAELVAVANPLSEKFAVLRTSLLPGLLDAVVRNRRREQRDVRLFEIAPCWSRNGGERRAIGCVWTGAAAPEHWSGSGRPADLFDLTGAVASVCRAFGVAVRFAPGQRQALVPGRTALVQGGPNGGAPAGHGLGEIGYAGEVLPAVAGARGLPGADPVYAAELDMDQLAALRAAERPIEPLPRFPSIVRDLALVVDDSLPAEVVRGTIWTVAPDLLVSVREFDRYQGSGVPEGRISLALRLTFRAADRTLVEEEAQAAVERIVAALAERHGATLRS